jgi:hypothetical protein
MIKLSRSRRKKSKIKFPAKSEILKEKTRPARQAAGKRPAEPPGGEKRKGKYGDFALN